ncbi:cytochrome P450 [Sporodiniella umbellata]|nr:cytochrome P450 [Sporodiniella umbellata]
MSFLKVSRPQLYILLVSIWASGYVYRKLAPVFFVPRALSHLPKVNTLRWFWSVLIGESHDVRSQKLVMPLMNQHGLCLKYLMGRWSLTVAEPRYLQVLLKDMETFPKLKIAMDPDLILTNQAASMSNSSYKEWKRQRKVIQPAFQQPMPIDVLGQLAQRMIRSIEEECPDGVMEVTDYAKRFALDGLGLGLFGLDLGAMKGAKSKYTRLYEEAFSIVRDPWVYLFPAYTRIPTHWIPYRHRARMANEHLRALFDKLLKQRKQSMDSKRTDLLSLLVQANSGLSDRAYLTDNELMANMATFFVAGHETTASALASFFYYLAANPEIQTRARQDVLSVLGDEGPEDVLPTENELKQMVYLNQCIKETMRINSPTAGNLPRITSKDTYLGNFFIPKDTMVHLELYCVHHLSNYWDQPEVFNPDRFNSESKSYKEYTPWMPFGYGPRTCVGINFSMSEQRVFHAMMLKKFTWSLVPHSEHAEGLKNATGGGIGLLGPRSLKVQLIKRHH